MRLRRKKWAPEVIARHPGKALGPAELDRLPSFDCLEIGSGRGRFLLEKAKANPGHSFLGVEVNYNAFSLAIKRIEDPAYPPTMTNFAFLNVPLEKMVALVKPQSIAEIYVNFPDPWPKKRQFKRRLTYPARLAEYYAMLKKGGRVLFKTDNRDLFEASVAYFALFSKLRVLFAGPYPADDPTDVMTEFETKFRAAGCIIYRIVAIKD